VQRLRIGKKKKKDRRKKKIEENGQEMTKLECKTNAIELI